MNQLFGLLSITALPFNTYALKSGIFKRKESSKLWVKFFGKQNSTPSQQKDSERLDEFQPVFVKK